MPSTKEDYLKLYEKDTEEFLNLEYEKNQKSPYQIADMIGSYANRVRRDLVKLGFTLRKHSAAQAAALKTGRSPHPTEGKKHSEAVKVKISEKMHDAWANTTKTERKRRSKVSKQQWEEMTVAERKNLQHLAAQGVRKAAKEGSKLETFLVEALRNEGIAVDFHRKGLIANVELEIDLYLPRLRTIIEIDGPAHFFPIWGPESLQKHKKLDAQKNGLLLENGFCIIRVCHLVKNLTEKHKRDVLASILATLDKIKKQFPLKNKRLINIEVA